MKSSTFILVLLACACQSRRPPVGAGEGIAVEGASGAQVVSVDPARVPLLSTCGDGELVWRARDGAWGCISRDTLLAELPPDTRAASLADVEALGARMDALEAKLDGVDRCGALPVDRRPPNYRIPAASCLISDWRESGSNLWTVDRGWITFRPGRTGIVVAYCPLLPTCDGSDRIWDTLSVVVLDPDGAAEAELVTATVYRGWNQPVGDQARSGGVTGTATLAVGLGGYVPPFDDRSANRATHWLEVRLHSEGGGASFGYAQID